MRRRSTKTRIIAGILAAAVIASILIGSGYGIIAASRQNAHRKPKQATDMNYSCSEEN